MYGKTILEGTKVEGKAPDNAAAFKVESKQTFFNLIEHYIKCSHFTHKNIL